MTEILERRWRCDYCGCVSPVLEEESPRGWRFEYTDHSSFDHHFCCTIHEVLWKQQQREKETA